MSEFEDIQRLIRLKRHETPGEDFVEDFITQFRERQRAELLRHSARGLLWERVSTYFDALFAPRWGMAAATAVVAMAAAWSAVQWTGAGRLGHDDFALRTGEAMPVAIQNQPALAVDSQLIREAEEDRQIQIESVLLSRHFNDDLVAADDSSNLPSSRGIVPVSAEMIPVSGF